MTAVLRECFRVFAVELLTMIVARERIGDFLLADLPMAWIGD